ncbi:hypothetical protein V1L54_19105 [Streptomyces sp. TRM 70361]|uniref:hypothetical protein n=1 Tax=Streptomyces sp. TRM 70361 TaxID=3116553 RepID=UPI002E7C2BE3|nr:hypothetical protein [Streptomyces sp. TRM 70361]MEE1941490.1 hypothetical protein [Streptomyces sp. TRM 70361]
MSTTARQAAGRGGLDAYRAKPDAAARARAAGSASARTEPVDLTATLPGPVTAWGQCLPGPEGPRAATAVLSRAAARLPRRHDRGGTDLAAA